MSVAQYSSGSPRERRGEWRGGSHVSVAQYSSGGLAQEREGESGGLVVM